MVAHLGTLDEAERRGIKVVVDGHRSPQESLFEHAESTWVVVDISGVRLERRRDFGDMWLALEVMRRLGMLDVFHCVIPGPRAKISLADMAVILVIARLRGARSELSIAEDFCSAPALTALLGVPDTAINDNRHYRAFDALLPHKDAMQRYLKERLGTHFDIHFDRLRGCGQRESRCTTRVFP